MNEIKDNILELTSDILINYSDTAYRNVTGDMYLENLPARLLELRNAKDIRFRVLDVIDFKDVDDVKFNTMSPDDLGNYYADLKWLATELDIVFSNLK